MHLFSLCGVLSLYPAASTHVNCGTLAEILEQLCHHPIMSITSPLATDGKVTPVPRLASISPLSNYHLIVCQQKMPF